MDESTLQRREDLPLTRADVDQLIHEMGRHETLDLRGRNLKGIDLAYLDLSGVLLAQANLCGADLSETDLTGADLSGANLSGCSGGTQPVAYLASHGVSDPVLSIAGGRSLRDRFVRNNQCTPQNPPEPAKGSRTHIATTYAGCSAGHPV